MTDLKSLLRCPEINHVIVFFWITLNSKSIAYTCTCSCHNNSERLARTRSLSAPHACTPHLTVTVYWCPFKWSCWTELWWTLTLRKRKKKKEWTGHGSLHFLFWQGPGLQTPPLTNFTFRQVACNTESLTSVNNRGNTTTLSFRVNVRSTKKETAVTMILLFRGRTWIKEHYTKTFLKGRWPTDEGWWGLTHSREGSLRVF